MTPASRQRQINANKTKLIQAKKLAFPWIPLAELGLFNALRRIQIKKSYFLATRVPGCAKRPQTLLFSTRPSAGRGLESGEQKTKTQTQDLRKQLRAFALIQVKPPENIRQPRDRKLVSPRSRGFARLRPRARL